jgi:predicted DNA-binding transcriptional regulator AlpA
MSSNASVTVAPQPTGAVFLNVKEVARRYGVSTRHIWRMCDVGDLPRPLKLGNACRWALADLEKWENGRGKK